MLETYQYPRFPYRVSDEQRSGRPVRHPVVVVGAGPIGLTAALDCAAHDLPVVVLDDNDTVSIGSRAVCYAKRALEVWNRLGFVEPLVEKGVSWQRGKVFFRDDLAYEFDLLPEPGHKMPAMINLQQYYLEEHLVARCDENPRIDLRWKHKLLNLQQADDHVVLTVETPDGVFHMQADWVIACDGANSDTRRLVGAGFTGQFFQDRFLIADVVMKADFPTERWFWFDPPFHRGQSVLLHKQADDVWRIDFQLGWHADPDVEREPDNVRARIEAMLPGVPFELEWVSIYQFACRRIDNFRYGRVLFAGDAAHQVSPFGARGANTGVQDIDNLVWKLAAVVQGHAPERLLDSYHEERAFAADDNLLNSTRSTDFITPKSGSSRVLRDAVLDLARDEPLARPLVNSGRLSMPTPYRDSSLNGADGPGFIAGPSPGDPCPDAPLQGQGSDTWLHDHVGGGFRVLVFGRRPGERALESHGQRAPVLSIDAGVGAAQADLIDVEGLAAERFDATLGTTYLIRPDQVVAARWREFDADAVKRAIERCLSV
ncbi:MAG: FAD-dependent oxidoreductase [Burkholderiaceae bacterium]